MHPVQSEVRSVELDVSFRTEKQVFPSSTRNISITWSKNKSVSKLYGNKQQQIQPMLFKSREMKSYIIHCICTIRNTGAPLVSVYKSIFTVLKKNCRVRITTKLLLDNLLRCIYQKRVLTFPLSREPPIKTWRLLPETL